MATQEKAAHSAYHKISTWQKKKNLAIPAGWGGGGSGPPAPPPPLWIHPCMRTFLGTFFPPMFLGWDFDSDCASPDRCLLIPFLFYLKMTLWLFPSKSFWAEWTWVHYINIRFFGISFDHYLHLFYYRIGLFQNQLFGLGNVCFVCFQAVPFGGVDCLVLE